MDEVGYVFFNEVRIMHNQISKRLIENNFECYVVGGAVRDQLMGVPAHDIDLCTNARPEQILQLFPNENVNLVGETFKVVIVNGVEVATFRKDVYFGGSQKNCEISYADTIEEDLARRDFTVNAMAINVATGELIDPFNGFEDLNKRIIRFVGNAEDRLREDPNRILRALRFMTKFGFPLHQDSFNTLCILRNNAYMFDLIAKERVYGELMKVLEVQEASLFFRFARFTNVLSKMFPSLASCICHTGGKHHGETVFEHCMMAGDNINTGCKLLKLAGYLHDAGKPASYDCDNDTFIGHEKIGAVIVMQELVDLKFPTKEAVYISNLIRMHMRNTGETPKAARRLAADLKAHGINYRDHIRLRIADRKANLNRNPLTFDEIKNMITHYEKVMVDFRSATSQNELAINGRDVMAILNITPGPQVGNVLRSVFNDVLDGIVINDRETLLAYIEGI